MSDTQQQLAEAVQLYLLYMRRAMRATPAQMRQLERKIARLRAKAEKEQAR